MFTKYPLLLLIDLLIPFTMGAVLACLLHLNAVYVYVSVLIAIAAMIHARPPQQIILPPPQHEPLPLRLLQPKVIAYIDDYLRRRSVVLMPQQDVDIYYQSKDCIELVRDCEFELVTYSTSDEYEQHYNRLTSDVYTAPRGGSYRTFILPSAISNKYIESLTNGKVRARVVQTINRPLALYHYFYYFRTRTVTNRREAVVYRFKALICRWMERNGW